MGRKAGIALLLTLFLFSTSCNLARRSDRPAPVDTGPRVYGDPNSTASPAASPTPADAAPAPAAGGGRTGGRRTTGGTSGGGGTASGGGGAPAQNVDIDGGGSPAAARPMLRPEPWTEIVVEIDYVQGSEPRQDVTNYVVGQLRQITGKSVTLQGGNAIPGTDGSVSHNETFQMSQRVRDLRSRQPRVALHIMYLNGENSYRYPGDQSLRVAGTAYGGTTIALWPDRGRSDPSRTVSMFAIEASILMHEIGHLLAQTEADYTSPRPRKDPGHGDHTRNEGSVMYWKAETGTIDNLIRGNQPMQFDADDLADFRDMAAGRL